MEKGRHYLVGGCWWHTPPKNMNSSVAMTIPKIYGKPKFMYIHVPVTTDRCSATCSEKTTWWDGRGLVLELQPFQFLLLFHVFQSIFHLEGQKAEGKSEPFTVRGLGFAT